MRFSLRKKTILIVLTIAVIISSVAIIISYREYVNAIDEHYKMLSINIAKTTASVLDTDKIEEYAQTLEKDEQYETIKQTLYKIKNGMGATYLYVEQIKSDGVVAIMDADTSPYAMRLGDKFGISKGVNIDSLLSGQPVVSITDERDYGRLCSAFYPIYSSSGKIVAFVGVDISMNEITAQQHNFLRIICLIIALVIVVCTAVLCMIIQQTLVKPIDGLALAASSFVSEKEKSTLPMQGDSMISRLKIKTKDEVGNLAESIKAMERDINRYMMDLTTATAEKERIGSELKVATKIQSDMLPRIFPPFPDRSELNIYAMMKPAKEVGGDFYDFFFVDHDHLALVIADVSGKGVPAALFMVIAKTLIKNCAMTGMPPKEVLERVNDLLFESNEAEMFVTVWLGVLDLSTGKLKYANAGHENPILIRGDTCEYLVERHGFVLAGMGGAHYKQFEITLNPGDSLFQYTDGVTEATDAENHLYGAERLIETVKQNVSLAPNKLLPVIKSDIDAFVGNAVQFDDITMLDIIYRGGGLKKITVPAKVDELDGIMEFVGEILKAANCPPKTQSKIDIAIDEIFSNICYYSGSEFAEISCRVQNKFMELVFTDGGIPYNPLEQDAPDITLSAEDRKPGGLGIYMVKKSMDRLSYEYRDNKNIFSVYEAI